jgi:hypothetical protein
MRVAVHLLKQMQIRKGRNRESILCTLSKFHEGPPQSGPMMKQLAVWKDCGEVVTLQDRAKAA